ncbi:MAG: hypothetical protein HRU03_05555 [Nanoarchaeales archaeon]|nr:hypothetical protein [Nanoarchaeales archaeon]
MYVITMPPSGFNKCAINGLLEFVKANYESVADKYSHESMSERDFLNKISYELEKNVRLKISENFENTDKMKKGIDGLAIFISECFRDLAKEIDDGKDKYNRPVIDGKAIDKELNQIGDYLDKFRI